MRKPPAATANWAVQPRVPSEVSAVEEADRAVAWVAEQVRHLLLDEVTAAGFGHLLDPFESSRGPRRAA
jgi:hypothetical protein